MFDFRNDTMTKRILILSRGNSLRSQIAEGFLRSCDHNLVVYSAGTAPEISVHPAAVIVMKESGIDISDAFTKDVQQFYHKSFDFVILLYDFDSEPRPLFGGSFKREFKVHVKTPGNNFITDDERLLSIRELRDDIRSKIISLYRSELKSALIKEYEI